MHGAVIWVFSTVLLQLLTQDRFRGRVFAAETSLFTASMMLSSVLVGHAIHPASPAGLARETSQVALALAGVSAVVGVFWVIVLGAERYFGGVSFARSGHEGGETASGRQAPGEPPENEPAG
jgi:hypothetical protein